MKNTHFFQFVRRLDIHGSDTSGSRLRVMLTAVHVLTCRADGACAQTSCRVGYIATSASWQREPGSRRRRRPLGCTAHLLHGRGSRRRFRRRCRYVWPTKTVEGLPRGQCREHGSADNIAVRCGAPLAEVHNGLCTFGHCLHTRLFFCEY